MATKGSCYGVKGVAVLSCNSRIDCPCCQPHVLAIVEGVISLLPPVLSAQDALVILAAGLLCLHQSCSGAHEPQSGRRRGGYIIFIFFISIGSFIIPKSLHVCLIVHIGCSRVGGLGRALWVWKNSLLRESPGFHARYAMSVQILF